MSREEITALFDRRADAWERRDAEALAATHAENAIGDSPMQGRLSGRGHIRGVYADWFSAFPDVVFTRRELIIDGNRVAELFTIRGTQSAPFHGVPATMRKVEFNGAMFFTIGPDGLVSEDRRVYDVTRVLVQLGLLRAKPSTSETLGREADCAH